jgi:hypothetical protein
MQKAKPTICEGNRNPLGLELLSAAAERGNYPEAEPKREGHERQTCVHNRKRFGLSTEHANTFPSTVDPRLPLAVIS